MLPDSYNIETTSNKTENNHGADIIIRIPGIVNDTYVIAIQVKDYDKNVGKDPVDQICKANDYFLKEEDAMLIDKYLIITKAEAELNEDLVNYAKEKGVKFGRPRKEPEDIEQAYMDGEISRGTYFRLKKRRKQNVN